MKNMKKKELKKAKKEYKKADKEYAKAHESKPEKKKVEKVMKEFKDGKLRSGSKKGPEVTNPKQPIAIALSESRKVGKKKKK